MRRGSAASRGYDAQHRRARARYLAEHPWCVYCKREGRLRLATVLDHIIPHRGDLGLLRDPGNFQGLCRHHHNSLKQSSERGRPQPGCDARGRPLDPSDPWFNA